MLSSFISSRTRRSILSQFLSNVEKKYYVRQLAVILNISVGSLHRELNNLEKSGILVSENLGNLRLFHVNKTSPIFKELKDIVFKTDGIQGALENALKGIKGIKIVFIYGSFARKEERADSDIDLFIAGSFLEDDLVSAVSGLEGKFDREINYTIYSIGELRKKIKEKSSFILEVLGGRKIFIIGSQKDINELG